MHGAANQKGEGEDLTPRTFLTQTAYSFFRTAAWDLDNIRNASRHEKNKNKTKVSDLIRIFTIRSTKKE